MPATWPLVLVEVVLVFGGVLVFGWWQLRSIKRDQAATAAAAEAERSRRIENRHGDRRDAEVARSSEPNGRG